MVDAVRGYLFGLKGVTRIPHQLIGVYTCPGPLDTYCHRVCQLQSGGAVLVMICRGVTACTPVELHSG